MSEDNPIKLYPPPASSYIGDAVYVSYDGYGFWLTTQDGIVIPQTKFTWSREFGRVYLSLLMRKRARVC